MSGIKLPNILLRSDKLEFRKPQVDQYIRASEENMKTLGLVGCIVILTQIIKAIEKCSENKHEEKLAEMEHEEKMLALEIEKMKLEKEV